MSRDEENIVCESGVGKFRFTVTIGKSDVMVVSVPLFG